MEKVFAQRYIGKFDKWADVQKNHDGTVGNVADCYVTELKGYVRYVYDGKGWFVLELPETECSLAEQGKCIVLDKVRIVGRGWVLVVNEKPKGLELESRMRCNNEGMTYTVKGFGGFSHNKHMELILSPNVTVNLGINVGDILQVLNR